MQFLTGMGEKESRKKKQKCYPDSDLLWMTNHKNTFFFFQWGGGVEAFEIQAKGLLHISFKEWKKEGSILYYSADLFPSYSSMENSFFFFLPCVYYTVLQHTHIHTHTNDRALYKEEIRLALQKCREDLSLKWSQGQFWGSLGSYIQSNHVSRLCFACLTYKKLGHNFACVGSF